MSVVNTPWVIEKAALIIFSFLDPFQTEKTKIFGENFRDFFANKYGKENIEVKYGGWIPNKTSNFFPPEYNVKGKPPTSNKKQKTSKPKIDLDEL
jgi:hypothetical protein